ncbi:MAG: hypothetical protein ACUVQP_09270 [Bacteroidales bacterium]
MKHLVLISLLFIAGVSLLSCHKPSPPKAVIITLDTAYKPMANVNVTVYAQPNGSYVDPNNRVINLKETTDASGQAHFEFKNEAILNVKAEYGNPVTLQATGMIFLKEGEEISKTLILR